VRTSGEEKLVPSTYFSKYNIEKLLIKT